MIWQGKTLWLSSYLQDEQPNEHPVACLIFSGKPSYDIIFFFTSGKNLRFMTKLFVTVYLLHDVQVNRSYRFIIIIKGRKRYLSYKTMYRTNDQHRTNKTFPKWPGQQKSYHNSIKKILINWVQFGLSCKSFLSIIIVQNSRKPIFTTGNKI